MQSSLRIIPTGDPIVPVETYIQQFLNLLRNQEYKKVSEIIPAIQSYYTPPILDWDGFIKECAHISTIDAEIKLFKLEKQRNIAEHVLQILRQQIALIFKTYEQAEINIFNNIEDSQLRHEIIAFLIKNAKRALDYIFIFDKLIKGVTEQDKNKYYHSLRTLIRIENLILTDDIRCALLELNHIQAYHLIREMEILANYPDLYASKTIRKNIIACAKLSTSFTSMLLSSAIQEVVSRMQEKGAYDEKASDSLITHIHDLPEIAIAMRELHSNLQVKSVFQALFTAATNATNLAKALNLILESNPLLLKRVFDLLCNHKDPIKFAEAILLLGKATPDLLEEALMRKPKNGIELMQVVEALKLESKKEIESESKLAVKLDAQFVPLASYFPSDPRASQFSLIIPRLKFSDEEMIKIGTYVIQNLILMILSKNVGRKEVCPSPSLAHYIGMYFVDRVNGKERKLQEWAIYALANHIILGCEGPYIPSFYNAHSSAEFKYVTEGNNKIYEKFNESFFEEKFNITFLEKDLIIKFCNIFYILGLALERPMDCFENNSIDLINLQKFIFAITTSSSPTQEVKPLEHTSQSTKTSLMDYLVIDPACDGVIKSYFSFLENCKDIPFEDIQLSLLHALKHIINKIDVKNMLDKSGCLTAIECAIKQKDPYGRFFKPRIQKKVTEWFGRDLSPSRDDSEFKPKRFKT